jgi:hypothetical protein
MKSFNQIFKRKPIAKIYANNSKGEFQFYVYSMKSYHRIMQKNLKGKLNYNIRSIRDY